MRCDAMLFETRNVSVRAHASSTQALLLPKQEHVAIIHWS